MDPVWLLGYQDYADRLFNSYSGINSLNEIIFGEGEIANRFFRIASREYLTAENFYDGSWLGKFTLPCWIFLYVALHIKMIQKIKYQPEIFLCIFTSLPLMVWYFFITDAAMERYFYIPMGIISFSCIFSISTIKNSMARLVIMAILVILFFASSSEYSRKFTAPLNFGITNYELDIHDAMDYIKKSDKPLALIGMRDCAEFEYLSEGINNFVSGIFVIGDAVELDEEAYLAKYPYVTEAIKSGKYKSAMDYYTDPDLKGPHVAPVKITKPISFDWIHDKSSPENNKQGYICNQVLFQNPSYLVERCVTKDIENIFSKPGGMPFRPDSWLRPRTNRPEWSSYLF